jgi:hypothetical protein
VTSLLGKGVYGFPEASRLAMVNATNTRRWFLGRPDGGRGPVLKSDIPAVGGRHAVSFLDLIDLRVVGQFRDRGISMGTIRKVYQVLSSELCSPHPFAHADLCVCGKTVLQRMVDHDGLSELREVISGQKAMPKILERFLSDIEYGDGDKLADRWMIADGVIIDPARNFGKPISLASGVGTFALASAYCANRRDAELVASLFDTSSQAVFAAVDFERRFAHRSKGAA